MMREQFPRLQPCTRRRTASAGTILGCREWFISMTNVPKPAGIYFHMAFFAARLKPLSQVRARPACFLFVFSPRNWLYAGAHIGS